LDRIDPKVIETSKSGDSGKEAYESLHESNIRREVKDGVARKVVRLQLVEVQELPKEVRGRESEAALKMSGIDHDFTGPGRGLQLVARDTVHHLLWYPLGTVEPVDFCLVYIRALPGPTGVYRQVCAGSLARAASFLVLPGTFICSGELFVEPVGFLGDGFFLPQGNLKGVAKLGSAGRQPIGLFRRHVSL
jgi:hypothetical protein